MTLNVYEYYDKPVTLPLYDETNHLLVNLTEAKLHTWGKDVTAEDLEPALHLIAKSAKYAATYAVTIVKGRWIVGEPAIKKSALYATSYALKILAKDPNWSYPNGRWPDAEPAIMKEPFSAFIYAMHVIKGRWKVAEPYIMVDGYYAVEYAEQILAKDPEWSYPNGRWPGAEPYIIKSPEHAYIYAKGVLKHRWEKAEPIIKNDTYVWRQYRHTFDISEE
jgi:hypothetical protein